MNAELLELVCYCDIIRLATYLDLLGNLVTRLAVTRLRVDLFYLC